MRAVDAASASPKIGSNIGAGPDVLAATLAGDPGMEILDASVAALKSMRRAASHSTPAGSRRSTGAAGSS